MFPVAWAIVDGETIETWTWFLTLLSIDLELGDGQGFTIISDQQKALERAIKDILLRVEHRNCVRHVYSNWSGNRGERGHNKKSCKRPKKQEVESILQRIKRTESEGIASAT